MLAWEKSLALSCFCFFALIPSASRGQLHKATALGLASPQFRWAESARSTVFLAPAGCWAMCVCWAVTPSTRVSFGPKSKLPVLLCCRNADVVSASLPSSNKDIPATVASAHGAPSWRCDGSRTFRNLGWKERGKEHLLNSCSGPAILCFYFLKTPPNHFVKDKMSPPFHG